MSISLIVWVLAVFAGLGMLWLLSSWQLLWERRVMMSEAIAGLLLASFPFLFVTKMPWPLTIVLVMMHVWLILLAVRLAFGRLPEPFLRHSTRSNSVISLSLAIVGLLMFWLNTCITVSANQAVLVLLLISIVVAGAALLQVAWGFKNYKLRKIDPVLDTRHLPTVTLAIPARNEDHALTECLMAAVASDYPKLEILVLDDCSQDNTSQLIRSFAHDGVRFIQGEVPAEGWLGKNQAGQVLAEQASGEYIVFIGVDTRLARQSISKLVSYALSNKVAMVSVLAQRRDGLQGATLLQQLRYFWQIILPLTKRRVPVASQAWLIKTDALHHLGGFAAVRHKIVPEGSFARRLFSENLYRFVISNVELGITTAKRWSSQNESAVRLLYPTCKRQPVVVLCALLVGLVLLAPFIVVAYMLALNEYGFILQVAAGVCALWYVAYGLVIVRTNPRTWLLTTLLLPFSLVQEGLLLCASMLQYEFGEVNWKGRNVCYPVLNPPAK